jgi:hypothetical protein
MKKSFNLQELLHHKSKRHETKAMQPSLSRVFQGYPEHNLKHHGLVDLIDTKQTTLLHTLLITHLVPFSLNICLLH